MLNSEWNARLQAWRNELKNHLFRQLGQVELEGFMTHDQLTPQQAARRPFKPMPVGTLWGSQWQYAWFRTQITIPAAGAGKRIIAYPAARESVAFVNGTKAFMTGRGQALLLTRRAKAGEKFNILFESYAGHGASPTAGGPVPLDRVTVPEALPTQAIVMAATFGVWQEDVYQLSIDVETLVGLMNRLPASSLRTTEVEAALRQFTLDVDFEQPEEGIVADCRAARQRIAPLLACRNGSTTPVMYCFGHAHLDTAWLWPLQHSERKAARSLANQLQLMEEYPEHKFLFSQPAQYVWLKEKYPELYARVKKAAAAGQVIPDGAMWVESDTNIPSGESLIRQFIHGKRFFREEFGVESRLFWEPDTFGYSGALPQIMRGCDVPYFSTAKIFWSDSGSDTFPYNNYLWEGIDGSTVLAFNHCDYSSLTTTDTVIDRWNGRRQRDDIATFLFPFGHGDGGGGPERDHLEFIRRQQNLEGVPQMKLAAPVEFFKDLERRGTPNRYVGELYFQNHRGTYTTQARGKRGNRRSELALREAELWGTVAAARAGYKYPLARLDAAWKELLLNQFHDILPGSSIQRVHQEAEAAHQKIIQTAGEIRDAALGKVTKGTKGTVTVFNSLGWERKALVELPADFSGTIQTVEGKTYGEVTVPSCGWTTIRSAQAGLVSDVIARPNWLENDRLRVTLNKAGEITSLFDKESGIELAAAVCNQFRVFKDVPSDWDAWNIDSMYEQQPVDITAPARLEVIAAGQLLGVLRLTRLIGQSPLTQDIVLRQGSRRLDFVTVIDWQERHRLLKVAFPVNSHADEALHEIQFGHVHRPTHRSRQFDATRFEVSQHKWTALAEEARGCAVLNDSKYGVNVLGNTINLTLLRSPLGPDMTADRGRQEFTYSFYSWNGSLARSGLVQEAFDLNCPVTTIAGDAGTQSFFRVDNTNVIIDTVKTAEDGSGDVIVRLYESMRSATRCTLIVAVPFKKAQQTNMLEESPAKLTVKKNAIALEFRPFEVKTIRLQKA
jgi:alpha-mannosidase